MLSGYLLIEHVHFSGYLLTVIYYILYLGALKEELQKPFLPCELSKSAVRFSGYSFFLVSSKFIGLYSFYIK